MSVKKKYLIISGIQYHNPIKGMERSLPIYLSKYRNVLYFEFPQFIKLILLLSGRYSLVEKISKNLTIFHSFGLLPFGRKIRLINIINHKFNFLLMKLVFGNKIKNSQIITFTPEAVLLPKYYKAETFFYYIVDEYTSLPQWKDTLQKKQFEYLENKLIRISKKIITASSTLYHTYRKYSKYVITFTIPTETKIYINNTFHKSRCPDDIKNISHPIAGFTGSLFDFKIDFLLISKMLKKYPQISYLIIGSWAGKNTSSFKRLFSYNNFYYINHLSPYILPKYVNNFDICFIPYRNRTQWGKAAYPVKVNEYLALGKPIITTAIPSIKYLGDKKLIYWSTNDTEFIKNIHIALNEKGGQRLINKRVEEGRKNDWNIRIKEFIKIIED